MFNVFSFEQKLQRQQESDRRAEQQKAFERTPKQKRKCLFLTDMLRPS